MSNLAYASVDDMAAWARAWMQRPVDFAIGDPTYMNRWFVVPRNVTQNTYLHQILRSDDDRALHDHPWDNVSFLLIGRYAEITPTGSYLREAGSIVRRRATDSHRLELIDGEPCVSLFTTGPKLREWGFHCPKGWVHWRDFTAGENGETIGKGCGDD